MTRTPLLLALIATAALAGCNNSTNNDDHTIVAGPDTDVGNEAPPSNGPVTLPPSIQASKIYRCKNNAVIYVDWLSDGSATVRTERNEAGKLVQVGKPGTPSLSGSADASTVTFNGMSCTV